MRDEIVKLQKEVGITSIFVTHDQSEALVMSDRIVVMDKAVIQQIGDPKSIYSNPVNSFVANFIGVANLFQGKLIEVENMECQIEINFGNELATRKLLSTGDEILNIGQQVFLSVRPEDIKLSTKMFTGNLEANCIEGSVIETVYLGNFWNAGSR